MKALFKRFLAFLKGSTIEVKPVTPVPTPSPLVPVKPVFPTSKGQEYYPKALLMGEHMPVKGTYAKKYPLGAVVHFTAGRWANKKREASSYVDKAKDTIFGGIKNGYTFLCIAYEGTLIQAHAISKWGWHAGESAWSGLIGTVSDDLIGIEMNCAGMLKKVDGKFYPWWAFHEKTGKLISPDEEIPESQVRYVREQEYGCPTGYYHKYSPEQEKSLIEFLVWLAINDPYGVFKVERILGHHEVSGKRGIGKWRKNDPGGSLSMTMDQLRATVLKEVAKAV